MSSLFSLTQDGQELPRWFRIYTQDVDIPDRVHHVSDLCERTEETEKVQMLHSETSKRRHGKWVCTQNKSLPDFLKVNQSKMPFNEKKKKENKKKPTDFCFCTLF